MCCHRLNLSEQIRVLAVDASFQKMSDAYAAKLAGMSREMCQMHPQGDASVWSLQDVVEHLVLTYRGSVAPMEKYLQRGLPTVRKADWKQLAARTVVVGLGRFPRGTPAPEFVCPGRSRFAAMEGVELGVLLNEELNRLDSQLLACERAFGARSFAPHFRLGPLSAKQWRKFHLVHGWHHLAQLERIKRKVKSPASRLTI
jgi:Protein of unknown function (DUF1569)